MMLEVRVMVTLGEGGESSDERIPDKLIEGWYGSVSLIWVVVSWVCSLYNISLRCSLDLCSFLYVLCLSKGGMY